MQLNVLVPIEIDLSEIIYIDIMAASRFHHPSDPPTPRPEMPSIAPRNGPVPVGWCRGIALPASAGIAERLPVSAL